MKAPSNIIKLPSGKWRVRVYQADGTRPGKTFHTLSAARFYLGQRQAEVDRERAGLAPQTPERAAAFTWPDALRLPCEPPAADSLIYFLGLADLEAVKIGTTTHLARRMNNLRTANPVKLDVLALIPGDREREMELHARFGHLRLQGEWFKAAPELVSFVVELRAGG